MSASQRVRGAVGALLVTLAVVLAAGPAHAAPPDPGADGAVVWDPATDAVLYDRAAGSGRPMASTTKIMTALLALEAGTYDEVVTVSAEAAAIGRVPGGASLGLTEGQRLPMSSLLAGLVLVSGNDAAVAVAEHVAGSEEAFVQEMNARADALGLAETQFVNSSGLTDDPAHRASPLDLARLADVAMTDPRFAELAGSERIVAPALGELDSRNELLGSYPGATGVKTGYTALAGRCLVASAERGGRTLYAVVLGADDSFADAAALLDHGFTDFRRVSHAVDDPVLTYRWAGAQAPVTAVEPIALTVPAGARVSARVELDPAVERPATPGTGAGEMTVLVDGEARRRSKLALAAAVDTAAPATPTDRLGTAIADELRTLARLRPTELELR